MLVVHDLLAHVDRRAVELERFLDGLHRPVDAGTVAARLGEQDTLARGSLGHTVRFYPRTSDDRPVVAQSSAEQPWPVRVVSQKISAWIGKLGWVWVDGQVAQLSRRPGASTVFLTLRDPSADLSLTVTASRDVLDSGAPLLEEGARVVVHAKPEWFAQRGTLSLRADEIRQVGLGELLARLEQLKKLLAGRRAVRPAAQAPAAVPAAPHRPDHRPGQRRRARRAHQRPAPLARGRLPRARTSPCRARPRCRQIVGALQSLDADDERRRDHPGPRRRLGGGPVALQRRGAVPGRVRLPHAGDLRDRPRARHPAGRLGRRRSRLDPHRRREAGRARPGRGDAPDRPGPAAASPRPFATASTASSNASTRSAAGPPWPNRPALIDRLETDLDQSVDRIRRSIDHRLSRADSDLSTPSPACEPSPPPRPSPAATPSSSAPTATSCANPTKHARARRCA